MGITLDAPSKIVLVTSPTTSVSMQELMTAIRNWESELANMTHPYVLDSSGKEELGGGVSVGLTLSLIDWKIQFEARPGPDYVLCNISGGNLVTYLTASSTYVNPVEPSAFVTVTLTSSSSATLQDLDSIQFSTFGGGVTIDAVGGSSGTAFPAGTLEQPCLTLADAKTIAVERGFSKLFIVGDITFGAADDIDGYDIEGQNQTKTSITLVSGCSTEGCEFSHASITGVLDGNTTLFRCSIGDLTYIEGQLFECLLTGTILLAGTTQTNILDCWDGLAGPAMPTIDCGGAGHGLTMSNYSGGVNLVNKTGIDDVTLNLLSGEVVIASSVTNGDIYVRGIGQLTDNSSGTAVVHDYSINGTDITLLADEAGGKWELAGNQHIFSKADNVTEVMRFDLYDSDGNPTIDNAVKRERAP